MQARQWMNITIKKISFANLRDIFTLLLRFRYVISFDSLSTLTNLSNPKIWNTNEFCLLLLIANVSISSGREANKSIVNLPLRYLSAITFKSVISIPVDSITKEVLKLMNTSIINETSINTFAMSRPKKH